MNFDNFDKNLDDVLENLSNSLGTIHLDNMSTIPKPALEIQIYNLDELPSATVVSNLCYLDYEVGIIGVRDYLFLIIQSGHLSAIELPKSLKPFERQRLFNLDFHSHPLTVTQYDQEKGISVPHNEWIGLPSWEDLTFLSNTTDGKLYIGEAPGIIQVSLPHKLPEGKDFNQINSMPISEQVKFFDKCFGKWLKINNIQEKPDLYYFRSTLRYYLEEFFGYKLIPWTEEETINQILKSKIN